MEIRLSSPNSARRICYYSASYGYARVCYDLPVPGYCFERVRSVPMQRLFPRSPFWGGVRWFFPPRTRLIHTFNDLVMGGRSWVVSHELELPRFFGPTSPAQIGRGYALLASQHCRRILSMSDAARRWFLRRAPDSLRSSLSAKTCIFTGAVKAPEHFGIKPPPLARRHGPIRLVFVGNDALRKGGFQILDAFDRLRKNGVNVTLDFVSAVNTRSYVQIEADAHSRLVRRLRETEGVRWVQKAPNSEVLRILSEAHVGLLPTLDDSLGWSVIEMMAARLPVVGTNVVALPEMIQNNVSGMLIDVPRDTDNRWIGLIARRGDREVIQDTDSRLVNGIVKAVAALESDDDLRLRMGAAGRARYEENYAPERVAQQLKQIYDEIFDEH